MVLSHSINYSRLSGYFRSDSLAAAAQGMEKFIENKGHMRLLCGAELTTEDLTAIKNAEDLKNIVNKNFLGDYENLEDQLIKDHVLLLGWMIANDFLEIKIGINTNGKDYYPDGMLHSKRGILYDIEDNCILFTGSVNETLAGWSKNIEDLRVDKSWQGNFPIKMVNDFENLWEGKNKELLVFDIPDESMEVLIRDAPKNDDELKRLVKRIKEIKEEDSRELFSHQQEAIKKWFDNGKQGILEMATGTGKTFTALKALEEVIKKENVLTVISCPFTHLVFQWEEEIKSLKLGNIHNFHGTNPNWRKEFHKLKFLINRNINLREPDIILTTHDTFSLDDFQNLINKCNTKKLLIVDEVHHVGAEGYSSGLLECYNYKLGLSATPSRYMDYEGTQRLLNYFGGIIYQFRISEALLKINPKTGKSFLTPYDYYPVRVYEKEDKYEKLKEILRNLNHKHHLIIFCSSRQVSRVLEILGEEGFHNKHRFTYHESTSPIEEFEGLSQRQIILKDFDEGVCQVLVAIKCLNEGVDVPSADQVIIMSSSSNPAEYIQRRGRVLRRFKGKEKAFIYDLCLIPRNFANNDSAKKEIRRLIEFTNTATSNSRKHCIDLFKEWGIL
ncbi:DEAD/DEAH box helicase family protein [uncultured Methanobrevibacter sp.]|uniref:DEAD/DEAH box helicase family protein n=1 Tax=uncultured Methanobrevibacter sp. TaxID=253161 RepID=UPI0025D3CFDA|nr:DEAD/DEAH box helicase family protein [uncultured Methanobrevibacter sp.]